MSALYQQYAGGLEQLLQTDEFSSGENPLLAVWAQGRLFVEATGTFRGRTPQKLLDKVYCITSILQYELVVCHILSVEADHLVCHVAGSDRQKAEMSQPGRKNFFEEINSTIRAQEHDIVWIS